MECQHIDVLYLKIAFHSARVFNANVIKSVSLDFIYHSVKIHLPPTLDSELTAHKLSSWLKGIKDSILQHTTS